MKLAIPLMASIAGVIPMKAEAKQGCHTAACQERVARHTCSQIHVLPCIRRAALHWHVSEQMLVRKARCESTLNPYATNGPHGGLFQFNYGTWAGTPYGRRSIFSAKWNALAAGWMHHVGRGGEWACQ